MLTFASPSTLNCVDWGGPGCRRGVFARRGDVGERTRSLPGAAGGAVGEEGGGGAVGGEGGGGGGGGERGGRRSPI